MQMRFIFAFLLLVLVASIVSAYFQLYERWLWVSPVMHLAGGAWVAAVALYLHLRYPLAGVALVGLGWECFEFVVDRATGARVMRWPDTIADLAMDIIGGAILVWLAARLK